MSWHTCRRTLPTGVLAKVTRRRHAGLPGQHIQRRTSIMRVLARKYLGGLAASTCSTHDTPIPFPTSLTLQN
jgi:hypothetical protein